MYNLPFRNNSHLIRYQQVDFLLFIQPLVFGVIFKKGLVEGKFLHPREGDYAVHPLFGGDDIFTAELMDACCQLAFGFVFMDRQIL